MANVAYAIKDNKLIITCDISPATIKKARLSKTGVTRLVGSTDGKQKLNDTGLSFSLLVMQKVGEEE